MEMVKRSLVARGLGAREELIDGTQNSFRAVRLFCMILEWWLHIIIYLSKQYKEL